MQKSDSVTSQVQAARQARQGGIDWPSTVTLPPDAQKAAHALAIYADLLQARSPEFWRPADATAAAHLALALRQLDELTQLIEIQGYTVKGKGKDGPGTGAEIVNPLLAALQQTSSRVESMSRRLNLGGLQVDARTAANATRTYQAAGGKTYAPPPPPINAKPGEVDWVKLAEREVKQ
jgi:hypothetical protein